MKIHSIIKLENETETCSAQDLTMMHHDKDINEVGLETSTNPMRPKPVWLLVTMVDESDLNIGEKPVVFAFTSEEAAKKAMMANIQEEISNGTLEIDSIDFSEEWMYAQTRDRKKSWEIVETDLQEE